MIVPRKIGNRFVSSALEYSATGVHQYNVRETLKDFRCRLMYRTENRLWQTTHLPCVQQFHFIGTSVHMISIRAHFICIDLRQLLKTFHNTEGIVTVESGGRLIAKYNRWICQHLRCNKKMKNYHMKSSIAPQSYISC